MKHKRIVIKLGTQVVTEADGQWAEARLAALVSQCSQLAQADKQILLVSSGAVGLGRQLLHLNQPKLPLAQKQACAAVGQNRMMERYRSLFDEHQLLTAQLLLTAYDFANRERYINLRDTLETLLSMGVIPVINENDTVSTQELAENTSHSFGDNDKLSAIVASKLGADLLVILTNVAGLYDQNPVENPDAKLIQLINGVDDLKPISMEGKSNQGRGGMASKMDAAKMAALSGVNTVIASGFEPEILTRIVNEPLGTVGTTILAQAGLSGKKKWLGIASGYNGIIIVNSGAQAALETKHASLLPSGIVDVQGQFAARQVISLQNEQGLEIGRGLSAFGTEEIRQIQGKHSQEIAGILGETAPKEVIHCDNLVVFRSEVPSPSGRSLQPLLQSSLRMGLGEAGLG